MRLETQCTEVDIVSLQPCNYCHEQYKTNDSNYEKLNGAFFALTGDEPSKNVCLAGVATFACMVFL